MIKFWTYPGLLLFFIVSIEWGPAGEGRGIGRGPAIDDRASLARLDGSVVADTLRNDSSAIVIDGKIRDSFPCVFALLQELVGDRNGFFHDSLFGSFFTPRKTRLIFSAKAISPELGARSDSVEFKNFQFKDTIFLNSIYFNKTSRGYKASREYMSSLVIHESVHAFITWCCLSWHYQQNGVDTGFLRRHFPDRWKWLIRKRYVDNMREHKLMSKNLIAIMTQWLYVYTNERSSPGLRQAIARSLTWGGLYATREWRRLKGDHCYLHQVDIWSRNMDADSSIHVQYGPCDRTDRPFLDSLQLVPLCP